MSADAPIRRADSTDAAALAELRWEFRSRLGRADEPRVDFLARCQAWMSAELEAGRWQCWVIDQDGPQGCIWVHLLAKIPNPVIEPERHAYVSNLYLRDHLRGSGQGRRLFLTAQDWLRTQEVDTVLLWPSARSRSLYESCGYRPSDGILALELGGHDLSGQA